MTDFHPLFPPNEDEDESESEAPDIQEILVQRKDNGKWFTAPRTFMPNELTGLASLFAEFGGGEYQLIARNSQKRIVRRIVHNIPGPAKPMFDDGSAYERKAPAPAMPAPNPMAAMMGGEGGIMGLVMMMMQQMMAAQQAASQNQSQMMMAFIQSMASGNQAQIQAAQENMRAQAERDQRDKESQMGMLVKLTEARGAGNSSGSEDAFFKGVEFMRHFSTQQIEQMKLSAKGKDSDFDLEGLLGTALEALQGFNAFREMSSPGAKVAEAASELVQ